MTATLDLHATTATDPGPVKTLNGDSLNVREPSGPLERLHKGALWVIADGLGSQEQGLRASRTAAKAVVDAYWETATPDPADRLRAAVERANTLLYQEAKPAEAKSSPFGATLLAGVILDEKLIIAHVGRSRAYLLRDGQLRQLTEDHTWVARQVAAGELTPAEALTHPRRNVITRCLGTSASIRVDIVREPLEAGDVLLFCSDGLWRSVDDETIAEILGREGGESAEALINAAKERGGEDNITAVTISVQAERPQPAAGPDRIALLSQLGYELTRTLDLDTTLTSVLQRLLILSGGERAAILLTEPDGRLVPKVANNLQGDTGTWTPSRSVTSRALSELRAILVSDTTSDDQITSSDSILTMALRSVLCVPMVVKNEAIGALYVDSSSRSVVFTQSDLDLLSAFAGQAAAAIENARLHEHVVSHAREIELAAQRQSALFRSLSSALIAVDDDGCVTDWNPAAQEILQIQPAHAVGKPLEKALPGPVAGWMRSLISQLEHGTMTIFAGDEWEGPLGERPRVILAGRVARIRDAEQRSQGIVFVLTDRTDQVLLEEAHQAEQAERQRVRGLFSRYLAPSVVERVLNSPDAVQLGGARHDVSILFADVRGFTGFSEGNEPEKVVGVLNRYLELATEEIFAQYGTLDKFIGDGVMAIFGAPISLPNHELAALKAALAMRKRLDELRRETGVQVGFGVGINSGQTIVGNIGTPTLMSYTAIGDVVNVAARLESEARSGEILISGETYARVSGAVIAEELGPMYVKGRVGPVTIYKVTGLQDGNNGLRKE
jgi:PAS domain S-box-containing protein